MSGARSPETMASRWEIMVIRSRDGALEVVCVGGGYAFIITELSCGEFRGRMLRSHDDGRVLHKRH
jgi:hypothetical protein